MGTRFWEEAFGELAMQVDGITRRTPSWADWAITTRVDTSGYWEQVWQAVSCHRSQLPGYQALQRLPAEYHQALWGTQTFYRVYSLVNGGRSRRSCNKKMILTEFQYATTMLRRECWIILEVW